MIVAIPCHQKDENQALRMLGWIAELGQVNAKAAIFCARDCNIEGLMQQARLAFTQPIHILDGENVKSNWSSDDQGSRDPSGPNSVFRQLVWNFYLAQNKEPWLLLEPDSVPMRSGWYEELLKEYQACGKPVMGDIVSTNSPHLSGVACYPFNVPELFPKMVHNTQGAFDMAESVAVLKAAHITKKIMDIWRCPPFRTQEDVTKIRPEACLFHASKDGSLIDRLREKKNGTVIVNPTSSQISGVSVEIKEMKREFITQRETEKLLGPSGPVVDIYLKTYPKDYELANYCLKSIAKFVTGYRNIIVEAPEFERFGHPHLVCQVAVCTERVPGYIDQQAKKLAAFKHTDADYILYVDSDCCFQRPFDVSEMFKDGKSTWQYTPFTEARPDQQGAWQPVMTKFLGKPSPNEFMRRHPHILPRWLPEEMDKFCRYRHGMSLDEYIMAQGDPAKPLHLSFSEFNCAGFFAWEFFKDRIAWVTDAEATPAPLVQGFTHGGEQRIKDDIEQFRRILGEDEPEKVTVKGFIAVDKNFPPVITIDQALDKLASEASQSPLHKARLMKRITVALGNPKKPQAAKRSRGRPAKKALQPAQV